MQEYTLASFLNVGPLFASIGNRRALPDVLNRLTRQPPVLFEKYFTVLIVQNDQSSVSVHLARYDTTVALWSVVHISLHH